MKSLFNISTNSTSLRSTFLNISKLIYIMSSIAATPYSSHYERMSGNCTRLLAAQMVANINPPITRSSYILDNACGPGIVSKQIKLLHPHAKILAADKAPGMVNEVQKAIKIN
jgi:ubiquinone/menaquinone biosynthesis C-methylase UbiE